MLRNRKIVLGIAGGIAAYKCAHLVRLLVKDGAQVRVVMTQSSTAFVTPATLSALSRNPVWTGFFGENHEWNNHVDLAEWADLMIIAPLTANTLAKMAGGVCDNVLLAVFLSSRAKVMAAPAMDLEMYRHPTVKQNLATIARRGVQIIPAETGELASGLSGEGRMAEPETIHQIIRQHFGLDLPLHGKKVLINAGPTYEQIDPVRFIGNRSSGKMGVALAEAFYSAGAAVTLVLGPSQVSGLSDGISVTRVETAEQMLGAMLEYYSDSDITVCSAAVADYRPEDPSEEKIKKTSERMSLQLVKNSDILARLGELKKKGQLLAGFALETHDLEKHALEKLKKKNLDLIVANAANQAGGGIGVDHNAVTLIDKNNKITKFELKSKQAVARDIVDYLIKLSR